MPGEWTPRPAALVILLRGGTFPTCRFHRNILVAFTEYKSNTAMRTPIGGGNYSLRFCVLGKGSTLMRITSLAAKGFLGVLLVFLLGSGNGTVAPQEKQSAPYLDPDQP